MTVTIRQRRKYNIIRKQDVENLYRHSQRINEKCHFKKWAVCHLTSELYGGVQSKRWGRGHADYSWAEQSKLIRSLWCERCCRAWATFLLNPRFAKLASGSTSETCTIRRRLVYFQINKTIIFTHILKLSFQIAYQTKQWQMSVILC